MKHADDFFRYSRERHNVYLLRSRGAPPPWTDDPVISTCSFTNIFRELDRVTIWFRQNIRDPLRGQPDVVPATAVFRWFNRITTGEVIAPYLVGKRWSSELVKRDVLAALPKGPWVTGSYMVHSPYGCDKLTGMLEYCDKFFGWWDAHGEELFFNDGKPLLNMEEAHRLLLPHDGFAGFTAYEVITDLRYAGALRPVDRMTWAHAGPGATRGGSRVLFGEPDLLSQGNRDHQAQLRELMRGLLIKSRKPQYWPQDDPDWPRWEMREVEHTLCEWDKYERVRRQQGRAKRTFRPAEATLRPLPDAGLGGL